MELILNDFSLDGQFQGVEDFADYIRDILAPLLDVVIENEIALLKKSDFYDAAVTEKLSLNDVLMMANEPAISLLKRYIVNLGYCEPYWDTDTATREEVQYGYPVHREEPNCFTEVIERCGKLISIEHPDFRDEKIICSRNEKEIGVSNITAVEQMLKEYLREEKEKVRYVLEKYPYKRPIMCAEVRGRCYANEALCGNNLNETDLINLLEAVPRLIEDLENGRKTDLWDKLQDDIFELRIHVSAGRIFRLLFVQYNGICFLNGFIKKTQKTPLDEIHKAVEIKKHIFGKPKPEQEAYGRQDYFSY